MPGRVNGVAPIPSASIARATPHRTLPSVNQQVANLFETVQGGFAMQWLLLVVVCLGTASAAFAQEEASADAGTVMPGALSGVPPALAKRLQRDAADVVEDAMTLILGYGQDGGIDRDGLARALDVERARLRAGVLRRLIEADLNADGRISTAEATVIAGAADARYRARIMIGHAAADADGDGTVTEPEARAQAQAVAMKGVSEADVERTMGLMSLDLDANGTLTLIELGDVAAMMKTQE
jgi:hypothetical protein